MHSVRGLLDCVNRAQYIGAMILALTAVMMMENRHALFRQKILTMPWKKSPV